jgi:hypothetical protein
MSSEDQDARLMGRLRRTYADRIGELTEFIGTNGRRPRFGAANAAERSLAAWLNSQIIARNKGELPLERLEMLEPLVPQESTRKIRPFGTWVADLTAFHAEHGRMPQSTRGEERGLALWLINKRMGFKDGTIPQHEIEALGAVPGALTTRKNSDADAMLLEAQEWCARHGHIPRTSFTDADALTEDEQKERRIAAWMRNHARESIRTHEPSDYVERRQSIRDLYDKYPSRTEFNESRARERVRNVLEHANQLPSSAEDSLTHGWIMNARRLRAAGAEMSPDALEILALADGLKGSTQHKRDIRLEQLKEFVNDNGRMPGFGKFAPKDEKNLAFWVKRRLDGSRTSGSPEINEEIAQLITECAKKAETVATEGQVKRRANPIHNSADCTEVMAALTAAGHLPESASPVYAWLVKHRKLRSAGTPMPEEISLVLEYADTLQSAREVRHERRLADYKDFIARFGRLPTPGGEKTEASLANWASGVLREVVNTGPAVRASIRLLQENLIRQTKDKTQEDSIGSSRVAGRVLDDYSKGERIINLKEEDESTEVFIKRLRSAVTVQHEQNRADAVASEVHSLRQLIQNDVHRGLVDGWPTPDSVRRSMLLHHRFHWLHDLAADIYNEMRSKVGLIVEFPMTCHSPYIDYGVAAVYGMLNCTRADLSEPLSPEERVVADNLERLLSDVPPPARQGAVSLVLGALKQLNRGSGRSLYAWEYDLGRARFKQLHQVPSYRGWPVSAATVSALLGNGSWNRAMTVVGLPTVLQPLNWQKSDFIRAALDFSVTASKIDSSLYPDFAYDDWVKQQLVWGSERPSLLSMHAEFGVLANGLKLMAGSADLMGEEAEEDFESEWRRVEQLLSETLSRAPEGATVELRVEEGEVDLRVPLVAKASITSKGADCSFPSALMVGTEHWPQDVKRILELGWTSGRDSFEFWIKESVPRANVAATLLSGLRECRGVTHPQLLRWSIASLDGEITSYRSDVDSESDPESPAPAGRGQDIQWANAVQSLTDELLWLKDDDFVSIEYGNGTEEHCAPYVQATPSDTGLTLELVSEQFLPTDVWPLNPDFLVSVGWHEPSDKDPNWHVTDVPRESAAKKLLDGLRLGRGCQDAALLRWHMAVFPPVTSATDE